MDMKRILLLLIAFVAVSCHAQQPAPLQKNPNDNTLLWQVTGNGLKKPSYLFGTFHLMCKDDIHISDQLKTAMERSDTVYMEMKMDDPSVLLGAMMYMTMKNGKTLKDLYTPEEYEKVGEFFKDSLKMPLTLFEKMKPYFLVSLFYPKMMDCPSPSGVEMELMKFMKENKKEIKGLETIQFQASVFDSIPYEWQARELMKNIDSLPEMKREFNKMVRLYKNQQMDSLAHMLNDSEFSDEKYGRILLTNRNENWAHQLDSIMKTQSVFVAVGAGHLPGTNGLIGLLRKMGYTVTPLKN